jgi:hypothetical protein
MKFKGNPNQLISMIYRVGFVRKNKRIGRFDSNGIFETEDKKIIDRMIRHFSILGEIETIIINKPILRHCKKCDFTCESQGELLKHYREAHSKE